ncbi:MAG: hypothetical protein A2542_01470 [Parcubacteria group bacterium RIFOXYD2_FULL_52_8]|nr:MAG: hypothetical protein A2542_01470 [Parcubacteria group bacterium RIFOXYD2_FULL_52_8]
MQSRERRTLVQQIARWVSEGLLLQKMQERQEKRFGRLRLKLTYLILRIIYADAKGNYPHKFDPHEMHRKVNALGFNVSLNLTLAIVDEMRYREKIEARDGSFNIEHYYCLGEIDLPKD